MTCRLKKQWSMQNSVRTVKTAINNILQFTHALQVFKCAFYSSPESPASAFQLYFYVYQYIVNVLISSTAFALVPRYAEQLYHNMFSTFPLEHFCYFQFLLIKNTLMNLPVHNFKLLLLFLWNIFLQYYFSYLMRKYMTDNKWQYPGQCCEGLILKNESACKMHGK